jgi:7-cyano-7-deazaguanine reductase
MARIPELKEAYQRLERRLATKGEEAIDTGCLLAFEYEHPDQPAEVAIETEEFTALCPWTGLPDFGRLTITYTPRERCVELKSLKYYLLSFRDVGIVQEHAACRILKDLVALLDPRWMRVSLEYKVRGGIKTTVTLEHKGS